MVFFANIQVLVIFSYTYFAFVDFADTQFMTKPASSVTHCSGTELEMEWTYPETDLDRILWQKASTSILIIGNTDNVISTTNVLEHVAKGKVKISSPTISDSGVYSVSVDYVFGSGTPSLTDTLTLTIQDAPAGLAFTVSSDTYTCTSTSLGTPAADLLIKVNDVLQTGSTYTSTSNSDNIECCFNGTAVTCIAGATNPYCIVAKRTTTTTTTPTTSTTTTAAPPPTTTIEAGDSSSTTLIIVLYVVGGVFILGILGTLLVLYLRKRPTDIPMRIVLQTVGNMRSPENN